MSNNSGNSNQKQQLSSSEQFKLQQRNMWDNVAAAWQYWWQTFEDGAQKVSDTLVVDLAELKPGERALDIATGIGEPAVTAANRVKPNGRVIATDISPQMIKIKSEIPWLGRSNGI